MDQEMKPDYSIIIPVYFNEGCLWPVIRALWEKVIEPNSPHIAEVIFVDDGSGDGSLGELRQIQKEFPSLVHIIQLTRNFGQCNALMAGYSRAKGQCVISISADGQEPPEVINEMVKAYFQEGYEVVIGTRASRDESQFRIITSRIFYSLMRNMTFPNMPEGGFDVFLMGRRALDALLRNTDAHPFLQGQILWMGFKTKLVPYHRLRRIAGASRWTFWRKITGLVDGVLAFSFLPIRCMSLFGFLFALLGFLYALDVLIGKLLDGNPVTGWAPLMIVILVMGGIQMLMLGVIGEYLWRTLAQVRNREKFLIEAIYDAQPSDISGAEGTGKFL